MGEGFTFLDEKCLLLAAEILRELKRYAALRDEFRRLHGDAAAGLRAALLHYGLQGAVLRRGAVADHPQSLPRRLGVGLVRAG